MHRPPHLSEADVLSVIERIVAVLAPRFSVPGFDVEDVAQEARVFALECLPRYDPRPDETGRPTRPLENFVMTHTRFRLINWIRQVYKRADPPCRRCHQGDPCGPDGRVCEKYARWSQRQQAKVRVRRPAPLDSVAEADEPSRGVEADVEERELLALIDERLPVELRSSYLQIRAGRTVPKDKRQAVEEIVRGVLGDAVAV